MAHNRNPRLQLMENRPVVITDIILGETESPIFCAECESLACFRVYEISTGLIQTYSYAKAGSPASSNWFWCGTAHTGA